MGIPHPAFRNSDWPLHIALAVGNQDDNRCNEM